MSQKPGHFYAFGPFRLDTKERLLLLDGTPVPLAQKAFETLVILVASAGHLVDKDELMTRLWPETFVEEANVAKHVSLLRKVLSEATNGREYIETIPKRGYRFVVPVNQVEEEEGYSQCQTPGRARLMGKKISHYRILDLLGGGGMGLVYKAEDLKLGRRVALKFLPEELLADRVALERFAQEARAASALNHQNVCTIHAIEEYEGQPFIVMEFLEGETLRELISVARATSQAPGPSTGALAVDKLLKIAIQTTDGLAAAHEKGIIHRDIKPANIFVTTQGQTKILDFGLAKLQQCETSEPESRVDDRQAKQPWNSSVTLTRAGAAVGTAGYMSPEQLRGEQLDARTDLFSLGMVLYEMATGQRAFTGETESGLCDAMLGSTPVPARELNPNVPLQLEAIITRALEKNRDSRYQDALEIHADLERLKWDTESWHGRRPLAYQVLEREENLNSVIEPKPLSSGTDSDAQKTKAKPRLYQLAVALLGACLVMAVAFLALELKRTSRNQLKLLNFLRVTNDGQAKQGPLVTDGSKIYATQLLPGYRHVLVQIPEKGGETIPFPTSLTEPRVQDISPDGSDLLVVADEGPGLWLVPIAGGSPRRVGTFVAYVASWHPDAKQIVYGTGHEVWTVQKDGTLPRKLLSVGGYVLHLRFSPDGRTLRFTVLDEAHQSTSLWEASSDGGSLRQLLSGWSEPAKECCGSWTPDGRYFIFQSERDGKKNIWALPQRGRPSERTTPLQLTAGPMNFSDPILAKKGKQILAIGTLPRTEIVRYDVRTREFVPYFPGVSAEGLDFSRTGDRVTYTSYPEGTLWRCRTDGSEKRQLTFPPLRAFLPRWSPDARQIAFMGMLPGKQWKINVISAEGGAPRELFPGDQDESDPTWSPDGNAIAFGRGPWTNNPEVDIRIVDLNTHQVSKVAGSEGLFSPRWSPDGRYIVALRMKEPRTPLLFDFTTQKWKELPGTNMGSPTWSMSGKYLYLQDWSTVNDRLVRIRLSDRKVENIAAFESIGGLGLGTIVAWTGVAPDDSPLLARDVSAEEVYAFDLEVP